MKRIGNIFERVCAPENLYLAYTKARKGKTKRYGVLLFEKNLDSNLRRLWEELMAGTYTTSEYEVFTITDPKERIVYRLPFRDRVVHHAIMNVLEPVWTSIFISNTYACIKGRGIHGTMRHLRRDLKDVSGTQYCLKLDIRKFYPSIDHAILKQIIRRKIKDVCLLQLLDGIIDSAPGVPIGNYLSQFFANLYLSYFDHWMKGQKRIRYYYRYADDVVVLTSDKASLHSLLDEVRQYLSEHLRLEVKGNHQVFPVAARGIDFVGYKFFHTHILLRKGIKKHLCRKAAALSKCDISQKEYGRQLAPLLGWAKHCDSKHLLKKVVKYA